MRHESKAASVLCMKHPAMLNALHWTYVLPAHLHAPPPQARPCAPPQSGACMRGLSAHLCAVLHCAVLLRPAADLLHHKIHLQAFAVHALQQVDVWEVPWGVPGRCHVIFVVHTECCDG